MKLWEYVDDILIRITQLFFFFAMQIHSKKVTLISENPVIFEFYVTASLER